MQVLVNFRDLGHLKTEHGMIVAPHRLLRAGEVVGLPKEEQLTLTDEYLLRTIVDFRRADEAEATPDDTLPGVSYHNIDILRDVSLGGTGIKDMESIASPDEMHMHMENVYAFMALDPAAQAGYKSFMELVAAQEEGALLFHCFAGKDRTGIGAAIVFTLLGVPKSLIFEDYLKTNKMRAAKNEELLALMAENGVSKEAISAMRVGLNVDASYLQNFFATVEENYGTFANYAKEVFALSAADVSALQKNYLLPA
ncbi:MAG: tyrosine-protein phosphatase [Christensenellaceae bacterium]|jgi:protein-tyrosine phosphatase